MGIQCGIVGLPNVGKSTLFNALTKAQIAAENYPFCTIDPNVGVVPLPDPRLDVIAGIVKPQAIIPTSMQFVDIAGPSMRMRMIKSAEEIAHITEMTRIADLGGAAVAEAAKVGVSILRLDSTSNAVSALTRITTTLRVLFIFDASSAFTIPSWRSTPSSMARRPRLSASPPSNRCR